MVRSDTWILSLKVVFMSTGVLSMALLLKMSVPLVMDFSVSRAPVMWSSFLSWLKPPYLYLIINGIIITIAASSRFNHSNGDSSTEPSMKMKSDFVGAVSAGRTGDVDYEFQTKARSDFVGADVDDEEKLRVVVEEESVMVAPVFEEKSVIVDGGGALEVAHEDAKWTPPRRMDSSELLTEYNLTAEKPLVSARFGHRKPIKASPEGGGRALRVAKPKRQETLENTWKMITEGRAMPLTRHMKKSDTWTNLHGHEINIAEMDETSPSPAASVKKSETFRDRTNYQSPPLSNSLASAGKLRKEPSLSQDELNRRVEAFIKKFNEEMRLQRQESLNQYKEMINRGL